MAAAGTDARVKAIIARHCKEGTEFSSGSLLQDLGMDSLDVVELAMDLEQEFDLGSVVDDWSGETTVSEVLRDVERSFT